MKWQNQRRSSNVEDRRSSGQNSNFGSSGNRNMGFGFPGYSRRGSSGFGFPIPIPMSFGRRGRPSIIRLILILLVLYAIVKFSSCSFLLPDNQSDNYGRSQNPYGNSYQDQGGYPNSYSKRAKEAGQYGNGNLGNENINDDLNSSSIKTQDDLADFSSVVLALTEDVWDELFSKSGERYTHPKLVIYDQFTQSGCGFAQAQTGPFYCPNDEKIYVDLSFYDDMRNKLGAEGGDFAFAYVLAHEVGHHVQNQLGVLTEVHNLQRQVSSKEANQLSVRLELQADYFAGVFAHYIEEMQLLDEGDIEEAIDAASAVGDDRIQKSSQGYVVPDSFTHGTSKQRMKWFMSGYKSGDMWGGDTFSASNLD